MIIEINQENKGRAAATLSPSIPSRTLQQIEDAEPNAIETFQASFCGTDPNPNSTKYVNEYVLPQPCEMPLGIGVDSEEEIVWYVSTNKGVLGSYDIKKDKFNQEKQIPSWPSREQTREFSQVWDVEVVDRKEGGEVDVWFTDEKENTIWRFIKSKDAFERYIVPGESPDFSTVYPTFIEFVPNNDDLIYFVGMFSPSIWIAEIDRMKNGTSEGISEVSIPMETFEGINPIFVTTGSLAYDEKENAVWVSVMIYGYKGQIFKYDLDTEFFEIFDLPRELSSPWGLTVDDNGDLWVTNAGSSIFYRLSPQGNSNNDNNNDDDKDVKDFEIEKFVTSKGSSRIFGKSPENSAEVDFQNRYYTLPSLIKKSKHGSVWFNEQHGNKISRFDPLSRTLTEYWIPSQNRLWGVCSNDDYNSDTNNSSNKNNDICGIANVLQFSIGYNGEENRNEEIWFSEWSENKIGKVETSDDPPFAIDIFESDEELTMETGEKEKIKFKVKAAPDLPSSSINEIRLLASGTFTSSGYLGNSTGYFTEQPSLISMEEGEEKEVSFEFIPPADLNPGDYTLMIGAENNSISYLKAIKIEIN